MRNFIGPVFLKTSGGFLLGQAAGRRSQHLQHLRPVFHRDFLREVDDTLAIRVFWTRHKAVVCARQDCRSCRLSLQQTQEKAGSSMRRRVESSSMGQRDHSSHTSSDCTRYSYVFMAGLAIVIVWLHLATPLLAALFAYLALTRLEIKRRGGRAFAVIVFLLALGGIAYVLAYFINQTIHALPEIGDKAIP